ncbi:MAG TPA: hypothetical protein PKC19_18890 [Roseiflexaceae bacterium]|nr:hypothetical protein [Roseiflexaceae bacterium]
MMNWHDLRDSSRDRHAMLIAEANTYHRARELPARASRIMSLRSRLADLLIAWGRWIDGRPRREEPRKTEQKSASLS